MLHKGQSHEIVRGFGECGPRIQVTSPFGCKVSRHRIDGVLHEVFRHRYVPCRIKIGVDSHSVVLALWIEANKLTL